MTQSATDVLDEVVQLFDQAVSARESRARHNLAEEILPVLADPMIPDERAGGLLRARIGMSRLHAALATPATARLPRDHGHLAVIDTSYGYLRQFTPDVLKVLLGVEEDRNRMCPVTETNHRTGSYGTPHLGGISIKRGLGVRPGQGSAYETAPTVPPRPTCGMSER